MNRNKLRAVITGDIIHSSRMKPAARNILIKNVAQALRIWEKDFSMRSEIFQGDSFQCLLTNPKDALRLALVIKTYIRSLNPVALAGYSLKQSDRKSKSIYKSNWHFDTRVSLGIGGVTSLNKQLAFSDGPAFHLSGRGLDEIKNIRQHLIIASDDLYGEEWNVASVLLDALISKTTALQCEVLYLKLLNYTEIEIARDLRVNQSAVNQRSTAASWNAIETMVEHFETIYV